MHHPLKQGLRRSKTTSLCAGSSACTSASSIKTRIKTAASDTSGWYSIMSTSASSIKTRIKTYALVATKLKQWRVRVHHPLKQGLRLSVNLTSKYALNCTSASSIKTRIKTCKEETKIAVKRVRVHHPLKQGLRLLGSLAFSSSFTVRVHHPLKQGLRR